MTSMKSVIVELDEMAHESERVASVVKQGPLADVVKRLNSAIESVGAASSQSWIGYHSRIYYRDFRRPPAADAFSVEWGLASERRPTG